MTIPGFTADASRYRTRGQYRTNRITGMTRAGVVPSGPLLTTKGFYNAGVYFFGFNCLTAYKWCDQSCYSLPSGSDAFYDCHNKCCPDKHGACVFQGGGVVWPWGAPPCNKPPYAYIPGGS